MAYNTLNCLGPGNCAGEGGDVPWPAQSVWTEASHGLAISHGMKADVVDDECIWYTCIQCTCSVKSVCVQLL